MTTLGPWGDEHYTLDGYQDEAEETAVYPGKGELMGLLYNALALGEAGEVQGKISKIIRDHNGLLPEDLRQKIIDEMGDVLWHLANLAVELDTSLSLVATRNIEKLRSRQERGVLGGSGDDR